MLEPTRSRETTVSVIVATYSRPESLAACLGGIRAHVVGPLAREWPALRIARAGAGGPALGRDHGASRIRALPARVHSAVDLTYAGGRDHALRRRGDREASGS